MEKDKHILIMKIASQSQEDASPCNPLSKASSPSKETPKCLFRRRKHYKSTALLRLKAKKAFLPLTGQQMATLHKLFEELRSVEVLLQTDIATGRPGDLQLGTVCIESVAVSSIMERRMKLRASIA